MLGYGQGEEQKMRVFLIAVLATVILTVGSIFALNTAQRTAAAAYTTEGARINPAWSWRRLVKRSVDQGKVGQVVNTGARVDPASVRGENDDPTGTSDACDQASALKWMFVDFSDSADEAGCNA